MNALAERLRASADQLARLDREGTWGPWSAGESWAGRLAILGTSGEPVAVVSGSPNPTETALADAALIATLRPLAPVIASILRQHAVMARNVETTDGKRWHISERCGWTLDPTEDEVGCDCFTDAIAVADAILAGGAS